MCIRDSRSTVIVLSYSASSSASNTLYGRSDLRAQHGLDGPFFFNRKEEKDHGEGGVFVGYVPKDVYKRQVCA